MKRVVNKSTHQYDFVAAESAELREVFFFFLKKNFTFHVIIFILVFLKQMVEARDHTIATLTQTVNAIQDQLNKLGEQN